MGTPSKMSKKNDIYLRCNILYSRETIMDSTVEAKKEEIIKEEIRFYFFSIVAK